MAELEAKIAKLKEELATPDLFARNPTRFQAAVKDLEAAEQELATAEDAWLAAEMARESLER